MAIVNLNRTDAPGDVSTPAEAVPGPDGVRPVTNWKHIFESKLDELAKLPKNWDSYGGRPINPQIIAAARTLIRALPERVASQPLVVPMSPGNLQLEWHRGSKVLEIEFENPSTIRYLRFEPQAGVDDEESIAVDNLARIAELIEWFDSGNSL